MLPAKEDGFRKFLKSLVYRVAGCFPLRPGNSVEATAVCEALRAHGIPCTLGKLSKAGDDPAEIVSEYRRASDALRSTARSDDFYLSVKPPALNFCPEHAEAIVTKALENRHSVHFDAHGFLFADKTLNLLGIMIENCTAAGGAPWTFGLTLPSRWKRSVADARWVIRNGVRPRIVKGDFKASPADEVEPVQGFLDLVDLLAGEVPEVAVATHDCILAREVVTRCRKRGAAVQLELFFGMPSGSMMALARELDVPLRFYVPYGDTLIVYMIRDLLGNPHKILRPSSLELLASEERKLSRIIAGR
jgi:proline dehydrogenase